MALKYSWAISYVPALKTYTISKTLVSTSMVRQLIA